MCKTCLNFAFLMNGGKHEKNQPHDCPGCRVAVDRIHCIAALPLQAEAAQAPGFTAEVLAGGLERPWDLAQLPDGSLLFTQRGGSLSLLADGQVRPIADMPMLRPAARAD